MPFRLPSLFKSKTPSLERAKKISKSTNGFVSEEAVIESEKAAKAASRKRIPDLHKGGGKTRKRNRRNRRR
jgi:hypothetical protein